MRLQYNFIERNLQMRVGVAVGTPRVLAQASKPLGEDLRAMPDQK